MVSLRKLLHKMSHEVDYSAQAAKICCVSGHFKIMVLHDKMRTKILHKINLCNYTMENLALGI